MVATPLGNHGDLSPRAKSTLEEADFVLAEDSKRAGLAFSRWNVHAKKILSINDHNEAQKTDYVLHLLAEGNNLALISDAGMPILSDPGYLVVQAVRQQGYLVSVIPGPCAPVTALAGSGIAPQPFIFFGFLPRKKGEKQKSLAPYAHLDVTVVFFERKDRIEESLQDIHEIFGKREICIARELTKIHEEYIHFYSDDIPDLSKLLGEITVIIGPPLETQKHSQDEILEMITDERPFGGTSKEIAKRVQAKSRGWTSSEIYKLMANS